eukprot:tig00020553_g10732.t1
MPWGRRATRRDDRATDAANLTTLGSATDPVAASASAPSRLPGGLEGDALVQGAAGVESGSDPVAASASAPSRLPGGLEGDALVQGAAGVESGSDPVAASASAPSRLPGGLEGDALVQGAAGVETGSLGSRPPHAANLPTLGSATDPVAASASAPSRLPGGFEGDAVGQAAVGVESGSDPVAASASAPSRLPGGLEGDALTDPFVLQLAPDAADDRAAAAANLPTLGSATDPVAASASAPSRLPGGFEGDAVGQAAVGVESGSDPVAASASAPSRLPGGLEGDALLAPDAAPAGERDAPTTGGGSLPAGDFELPSLVMERAVGAAKDLKRAFDAVVNATNLLPWEGDDWLPLTKPVFPPEIFWNVPGISEGIVVFTCC